jgi:hypothetical protein
MERKRGNVRHVHMRLTFCNARPFNFMLTSTVYFVSLMAPVFVLSSIVFGGTSYLRVFRFYEKLRSVHSATRAHDISKRSRTSAVVSHSFANPPKAEWHTDGKTDGQANRKDSQFYSNIIKRVTFWTAVNKKRNLIAHRCPMPSHRHHIIIACSIIDLLNETLP